MSLKKPAKSISQKATALHQASFQQLIARRASSMIRYVIRAVIGSKPLIARTRLHLENLPPGITRPLHQSRRQRGGHWWPPLISCLVPRLLHTSNIVFKKCAPTCGFWSPLLRHPGDGPAQHTTGCSTLGDTLSTPTIVTQEP